MEDESSGIRSRTQAVEVMLERRNNFLSSSKNYNWRVRCGN